MIIVLCISYVYLSLVTSFDFFCNNVAVLLLLWKNEFLCEVRGEYFCEWPVFG